MTTVSSATAAAVKQAFAAIVGADHVFFDQEDQTSYQDKFAIDDALHHPAGAVAPASVEEIQAIVRVGHGRTAARPNAARWCAGWARSSRSASPN